MSILDDLPLDHGNEALQQLVTLLEENIDDPEVIKVLAQNAGMKTGMLRFGRAPALLWWDLLDAARGQGRQWQLIEKIKRHRPAAGARIDALVGASPPQKSLPAKWKGGVEKQTGARPTLLDISFLEKGVHISRAVVHLSTTYADHTTGNGTGFLIGRDLLLSNHHVLFDDAGQPATSVLARFRYEEGVQEIVRECVPKTIQGAEYFDWAVVRLREPAPEDIPSVPMKAPSSPVQVGFPAFIIQHPRGEKKKVGLYHNEVRYVDDEVIQYLTDTEVGSSGSPVFDKRWELIALHHQWVTGDEANAKGVPPGESPAKVLNQGVRIERVIAEIAARGLL